MTSPSAEDAPVSDSAPEPHTDPQWRDLRDPKDMRALAHPTRLALLEALALRGPLTATEASELVGESPSSCSFHLRSLARHNFVEETGEGHGRQRPWRLVSLGTSIGTFDDAETTVAADALASMFMERELARLKDWSVRRHDAPPEWERASTSTQTLAWVTADELRDINAAVLAVMDQFRARILDPSLRPDGAKPVEALYFAYPVEEWDRPVPPGT